MSDSLCGPSNPSKGLTEHLDRDRSLQQDRIIAAGPANPQNFRNAPQNAAIHMQRARAIEAMSNFEASPHLPSGIKGLDAFPRPSPPAIQSSAFQQPAGSSAHSNAAPFSGPNTSWVDDFRKMQLHRGHGPQQQQPLLAPSTHHYESPQLGLPPQTAYGHQQQARLPLQLATPQYLQQRQQQPPVDMSNYAYGGFGDAVTDPTAGRATYPNGIALAASAQEAISAAFAEYEDSFQHDMDQWMDGRGPSPTNPEYNTMAEFTHHRRIVRGDGLVVSDQEDNTVKQDEQEMEKKGDDNGEFRMAALSILEKIDSTGKSNEIQAKFQNSSFVELMKRVTNQEVVLQGETLVDTTTGQEVNLGGSSVQNGGQDDAMTDNHTQKTEAQDKGKAVQVEDGPSA